MTAILLLARAQLRRSWRAMLVMGLVAGVTGGVVLVSAQLARRTGTAYDRLQHAVHAPDALIIAPDLDSARKVLALPMVKKGWLVGTAIGQLGTKQVQYIGVTAGPHAPPEGLFTPIVVRGRAARPTVSDEAVITEHAAQVAGLRPGDDLPLAFLTPLELTQFDTGFGEPDGPKVTLHVVGVIRGGIEAGLNAPEVFSTPAFARRLGEDGLTAGGGFAQLRHGAKSLPAFQRAVEKFNRSLGPRTGAEEFVGVEVQIPGRQRPVAAATARVLDTGVGVFAGIAAIAGVLALLLVLRRHFATAGLDLTALSAVGVTRSTVRGARVLTALLMVVVGVLTAVALGFVFAGLDPLGSLASREPHPGWHPNIALLAVGGVVTAVALLALAALAATPQRAGRSAAPDRPGVVDRLARLGAPAPTVVGARFALHPGRGGRSLPVRTALAGTALGVLGVVAVTVFAASLDRMVDTPARWGWDADALLADFPNPKTIDKLAKEPEIRAIAAVKTLEVSFEGQQTSADAFTQKKGVVTWTVLHGHMPRRRGEILLGARLAHENNRSIGDSITLNPPKGPDVHLEVVGIGTGPELSAQQFGGGVVIVPADIKRVALTQPFLGAALRWAPGVDEEAASRRLGSKYELTSPEQPPDVKNLAELGALPEMLGGFLALLGVVVLAHLMVSSTRRRRRELDTLRAVGFVGGQVRRSIATAALITVTIGLVIGIPLGLAAGRLGWRSTAESAYVAGDARMPVLAFVVVAIAAVLVALAVAAWPAWRVTHAPIAGGLREE